MRQFLPFGLLGYLISFFFLGASEQKTAFYLLVALPSLFLLADLRNIFRDNRLSAFLVIVFVAYFSLSSLWSADVAFLSGLKVALSIGCLMIAANAMANLRSDSATLICYWVMVVGVAASLFYIVSGVIRMGAIGEYSSMLAGRYSLRDLSGWGDGNPINSAVYFGLVVLLAWWLFPNSRSPIKLALVVVITACAAIMFLSKSRGPILSLAIVLLFVSLVRRSKADLMLGGGLVGFCSIAVIHFDLMPLVLDRANSPNYRIEIWLETIELIKKNLLFGQGVGQAADIPFLVDGQVRVTVSHSHSSLLEAFRLGGLVGGALFLAVVVSVLRRSMAISKDHGFFAVWLIYGLLCLGTNGRSVFIRPSIEWFCFWIPLFLALFSAPSGSQAPDGGFHEEERGERILK